MGRAATLLLLHGAIMDVQHRGEGAGPRLGLRPSSSCHPLPYVTTRLPGGAKIEQTFQTQARGYPVRACLADDWRAGGGV